jgi:hypothetical protein
VKLYKLDINALIEDKYVAFLIMEKMYEDWSLVDGFDKWISFSHFDLWL